jgi:hypothetical protein
MKETNKQKPNTPQKYGYAHKVIPIRKRIWQKVMIRWVVLLVLAVVFFILNLIGEKVPTLRNYPQMIQLGRWMTVFLWIFIFFNSRVLPLTFSKEWVGIVRDRKVDKYTRYPKGIYQPWGGDRAVLATRCIWTVEREDGDLEKVAIDTEEIWERYFEIGEKVRMYKNAKLIVKAHPPRGEENLICPLCGVMVMEPICRKCGVDFTEPEPDDEGSAEAGK